MRQLKMAMPDADLLRYATTGAALEIAALVERQRAIRKRFPTAATMAKQILAERQMARARAAKGGGKRKAG